MIASGTFRRRAARALAMLVSVAMSAVAMPDATTSDRMEVTLLGKSAK